jgi:hypothetical protein
MRDEQMQQSLFQACDVNDPALDETKSESLDSWQPSAA